MTTTCSFCGTTDDETDEIIIEGLSADTGVNFAICESCVAVCNEVITANKKSEAAQTTPPIHEEQIPMTTKPISTPIPGNTQEALTALREEFPTVHLCLQHKSGWQLHASGPCGSVTMQLSDPIRTASLRAACQIATEDNIGGDAA